MAIAKATGLVPLFPMAPKRPKSGAGGGASGPPGAGAKNWEAGLVAVRLEEVRWQWREAHVGPCLRKRGGPV